MTDSHAIAYAYLRSHIACWHERLARWIAFRLPSTIVYWCVIRAGVHATSGQWSDQVVPDLRLTDILTRWGKATLPSKPISPAPAASLADQKASGALDPYVVLYDPRQILNWDPLFCPPDDTDLHRMADDGCPHE